VYIIIIIIVYFVIDSVRKLLDTPSHEAKNAIKQWCVRLRVHTSS